MISWMTTVVLLTALTLAVIILTPLSVIARTPASIPALLAYGSTDVLGEYFTKTRATTAPVAREAASAPTCDERLYTFNGTSGLQHSQYYADPKVSDEMGVWLRRYYK